jgi:hypothetical protein
MKNGSIRRSLATIAAIWCVSLDAATITTVVSGLSTPTKTALTSEGNLLVAEAGTGNNAGRISLVDTATGSRRTVVDGLPSGFAGPVNGQSGPSGLALNGRTLYFTIGTGDSLANGMPGLIPNPRPSSPLLCTLLALHFTANPERTATTWTLSAADHAALKAGTRITRDNGAGDLMTLEMVADLPDSIPEPIATQPNNVRPANPYGAAVLGDRVFVVDASLNSILSVDLATRAVRTLTTFGSLPNTRGTGPVVVEAVPDSIRAYGNQLLVTLLTGSPYPLAGAEVRLVDPDTGASTPFIIGLTSAIDVLPLPGGGFLTLEYTSDAAAGAAASTSGRIKWFATPAADPVVVASNFSGPTRLELDDRSGALYVTENVSGRIVKVSEWSGAPVTPVASRPFSNLSVRGHAGSGNETLTAGFTIDTNPKQVLVRGIGPQLAAFGVTGPLADPRIVVFDRVGRAIADNDNWIGAGTMAAQLADAAAKVGAFPLPAGSRDAALLRVLPPGAYTVQVSGVGGTAGIAVVEVFHVP